MISDEYRLLNAELHANPSYGSNGAKYEEIIRIVMDRVGARTVLDYGCGKGSLKKAMGDCVSNYDPSIPEFSEEPSSADLVVCTDVLEHVEPEHLDSVLAHIKSLGKHCLLVISTREARKTLPDGRNAHLIVQPAHWWEKKVKEQFTVLFRHNETDTATFVCK